MNPEIDHREQLARDLLRTLFTKGLPDIVGLSGIGMVFYGFYQYDPPLAYIIVGFLLIAGVSVGVLRKQKGVTHNAD